MWTLGDKIYLIKAVFEILCSNCWKGVDADSDSLRFVLWCCGSRSQEEFTFVQVGSRHTVLCCLIRTDFSKSDEFFAVSEGHHGTNSKYLVTEF